MRHPRLRTRMGMGKGMGMGTKRESVRDALAVLELELLVLLDHRDHVRLLLGRQTVAHHCRRRACVAASDRSQLQFNSIQPHRVSGLTYKSLSHMLYISVHCMRLRAMGNHLALIAIEMPLHLNLKLKLRFRQQKISR